MMLKLTMRRMILFLFALISSNAFSQIIVKGTICSRDREPLPYVNIVVLARQNGTASDANGRFELNNLSERDSLKISAIGYTNRLLTVKYLLHSDTVFLDKHISQLGEVTIRDYTQNQRLGFEGYVNNASFNFTPGGEVALYFENKMKREALIKQVSFSIKAKGKCNCSIRVRLLNVDIKNRAPGDDLLTENVMINAADLKKENRVDLEKYHVLLPRGGVFVVLEWVYADAACDKNSYAIVAANMSMPDNLVWLNFRDKHWGHSNIPRLPNNNHMTPNIGLKVAY
jgi:hypothetical protein